MRRLPVWNFYPGGTFTLVELLPGWNFYPGWNFCLGGTFTLGGTFAWVELLPWWNFYLGGTFTWTMLGRDVYISVGEKKEKLNNSFLILVWGLSRLDHP